jgi:hypothetical protein
MINFLLRLLGIILIIYGIYYLGNNIIFTTNVYPYWWRGIAADFSVLCLTGGVAGLFMLPQGVKNLGWLTIMIGIIFVFMSSRAILNPTSLWSFFVSVVCLIAGVQLFSTGKLNI